MAKEEAGKRRARTNKRIKNRFIGMPPYKLFFITVHIGAEIREGGSILVGGIALEIKKVFKIRNELITDLGIHRAGVQR